MVGQLVNGGVWQRVVWPYRGVRSTEGGVTRQSDHLHRQQSVGENSFIRAPNVWRSYQLPSQQHSQQLGLWQGNTTHMLAACSLSYNTQTWTRHHTHT